MPEHPATPKVAAPTSHMVSQVSLQQRGELPVLQVRNAHADAAIALQGAQLLDYTPRGQQPLVWLSERADYRRGQSVRGGIPLCWPWFGAIERNPAAVQAMATGNGLPAADLPAHGLIRARDWTLRGVREQDDATEITLGFDADHRLQQSWPHAAELTLQIVVGRSLRLALTVRNADTQPLTLTQALHTYLAVSDIDAVTVTGFEASRCIDTLHGWREQPQQGAIAFNGETDRIYLDVPHHQQLHDCGWSRTIHLRTAGSSSAVVWNPWIEKSQRLSQFAPDAWRRMVCIETANVLGDAIALAPGATHTLALELSSIPSAS